MPSPLPDLQSRADLEQLIERFYQKAMADETIGHFFTQVVKLDLESHLPKICDFWESTLFHTGNYTGNPMLVHKQLNAKSAMKNHHFEQWLQLFNQTVDELHAGPVVEKAKTRALSIATIIRIKLVQA